MNGWKIAVVSAVAIAAFGAGVYCGQQDPAPAMDRAGRETYLREFDRTGLATTPEDAMLLRILVAASGAKRGIEVGTEAGFGAVNMGIAFERTGGRLHTLEISPRLCKIAREHLRKTGLDKTVTVVEGDALKTLGRLEGTFDFLFLDALKRDYLKYLKLVEDKLEPGSVIVADNTIRSARAMRDFLTYLAESDDYETVTVRASDEKRDGMTIAYKIR